MLRIVKAGGAVVAGGIIVGISIAGWLYTHRPDDTAATKPGSVGFDLNQVPSPSPGAPTFTPTPADQLSVTGSAGGAVLGTDQQGTAISTPKPPPTLPGPSEFGQYDQYKANAAALYIDVVAGTGQAVTAGSKVAVSYSGYFTNGTEFDRATADKPFTFTEQSGGVIVGFLEGVYGMKVGGRRRIIVPPAHGYGATAYGPIPASSVLVFDIELLGVQ